MLPSRSNVDVRRFHVLLELRDRGTIAATAEALCLTPSAVSQQIKALSEEIGVPLLFQQGRGVNLTPQAHVLIKYAMTIDRQLELAKAELTDIALGKTGHVAIGVFASAVPDLVAPALSRLLKERPSLEISIREINQAMGKTNYFNLLDRNELDAIISVDYPDGPRWDKKRYSRFDLLFDPMLVAVPEDDPLAAKESLELSDLVQRPWVMAPTMIPSKELSLAACTTAGYQPKVCHFVDNWIAVLALVANGLGVALVPRLGTTTWTGRGVAFRPLGSKPEVGRHIYVALRSGSELNPNLIPVLEALKETARTLAAAMAGRHAAV